MSALERQRLSTSTDLAVARETGEVAVITSSDKPPKIVSFLDEFIPDEAILEREATRYQSFSGKESAATKSIKAAHDALENGRVLIDIARTLPQRYEQFPRLAVGRPTDKQVWCRVFNNGTVQFRRSRGRVIYEFQDPKAYGASGDEWVQRMAFSPTLPPELVTVVDVRDPNLLYLWEAEWVRESTKPKPRPARDPALLEHVAGSLYAVVAVWELSPIESAALGKPVK